MAATAKSRPKAEPAPATCLMVLGMHRSGTSALTRLLNLLGVDLGSNLMGAAADNNETGFWEHQGVVDLHEAALAHLGMTWDDPRPMPDGFAERPDIADIADRIAEELGGEFAGSALWGVKDPRHCRTLPLWSRVFEALSVRPVFVIMVRNPLEVAQSLQRRDGLPLEQGLLVWLRHMIEAERASRGHPRVVVRYDALLADWRSALAGVDEALGVTWSSSFDAIADQVAGFLDPSLHHHQASDDAVAKDDSLSRWVRDVYAALIRRTPVPTASLGKTLDGVARDMTLADALYTPALDELRPTVSELRRRVLELERQVIEREARLIERDGRIAERDSRIDERDVRIAERDSRIAERDNAIRERDERLNALHQEVQEAARRHAEQVKDLTDDVEFQKATINQIFNSTSWRLTAPVRWIGHRLRSGSRLFTRRWYLNPVLWVLIPLRLLLEAWRSIRLRRHRMLVTPLIGASEIGGGWMTLTKDEAHLTLHSNRLTGINHPSYAVVTIDVEVRSAPVQLWLYKFGTSQEYRQVSVRLPMRAGRHRFLTFLPEGATSLRAEPSGVPGASEFRIRELTIFELGTLPVLMYQGARYIWRTIKHPARGRQLLDRLINFGLLDATRAVLRDPSRDLRADLYQDWIDVYDTLSEADVHAISGRIAAMKHRPTLSIVMPTYNTPHKWLRRCLDSVIEQLYPDWELCIADDNSPDEEVRRILREYADRDSRIKLVFRDQNGHISRASNSALELATGEFMVLLDHDDELPRHALYMVAEEINACPDADIIFSDEDKIDLDGRRFDPYFKSQYNVDLFLSHNMISHLGVYRTELIREIGGFRPEFDGSQDYDLALRAVERTTPERIRHIPHILYHWRAIPGSVALSGDQKEYAHIKARAAIKAHLDRTGRTRATIEATHTGTVHRVAYPLPDPTPRVSVIIPTKNSLDLLKTCIGSLTAVTRYPDIEILVVDNDSDDDETLEYLKDLESEGTIRVIGYPKPFNYAEMNNLAVKEATGSVLCFLNNDIEAIHGNWLEHMVSHALRPNVGAVGAKLYFPGDTVQHAGVVLTPMHIAWHAFTHLPKRDPGYVGRAILQQDYSSVTAACMVVARSKFEEVGGFDAEAFPISYNDVDLCLRLRDAGYRTFWTPFSELYHHQSASLGLPKTEARKEQHQREVAAFRKRWGEVLEDDPCYSPNLSERFEDFSLAFPPRSFKPWRHDACTASRRAVPSGLLPAE